MKPSLDPLRLQNMQSGLHKLRVHGIERGPFWSHDRCSGGTRQLL